MSDETRKATCVALGTTVCLSLGESSPTDRDLCDQIPSGTDHDLDHDLDAIFADMNSLHACRKHGGEGFSTDYDLQHIIWIPYWPL